MENVIITKERENYWVVRADTVRFGTQEIMYEGINRKSCYQYLKKNGVDPKYVLEYIHDDTENNVIHVIKRNRNRTYFHKRIEIGSLTDNKFEKTTKKYLTEAGIY